MFQSARLKLTAWYLLIIMVVSITFSLVIYRVLVNELVRFERAARFRMERRINPEIIEEIKQRIALRLFLVDSLILVFSGGLGYFLAGKTLKPISEMVEEQNRFISDASHEFRTPLTSLKSSLEVHLRDKNLSLKDAKALIKDNIEEVNKLQSLSDSLLELAQFQKPGNHLSFESLSLKDIVSLSVRKVSPMAKKKQINIISEVSNIKIEGVKQSLIDLLIILLDNAIKYTPSRQTVNISAEKTDGTVLLSVKDQGIGIDKKDLPFIFDRFYRSDKGRSKSEISGYGLGLSIAQKIVKLHNGSISAESKPGSGSVFRVKLPIRHSLTA